MLIKCTVKSCTEGSNPSDSVTPLSLQFALVVWATGVVAMWFAAWGAPTFVPGWDEAKHLIWGWRVAEEALGGDALGVARDSYAQLYWSFLHAWWVAPFMIVLGPSALAGRLSSAVALVGAVVALGAYAAATAPPHTRERRGAFAALMLLVPMSMPTLAGRCMIELPALMLSVAALAAGHRALSRGGGRRALLAGALVAAAFFMKYPFGLALGVSLALAALLEARGRPDPRLLLALLGPLALGLVLWVGVPRYRLPALLDVFVNRPQGPSPWSLAGLLFYPRVLVAETGPWAAVWLAGAAYGAARPRTLGVRLWGLNLLVVAGMLTVSHTREPRYLLLAYPALILLGARALDHGVTWLSEARGVRWAAVAVLGALVTTHVVGVGLLWRDPPRPRPEVARLTDFVVAQVRDRQSVLVVGEGQAVSGNLLEWQLETSGSSAAIHTSSTHRRVLASARPARTPNVAVDADAFAGLVSTLEVDAVVAIEVADGSALDDADYRSFNAWKRGYAAHAATVVPGVSRTFFDGTVRVTVGTP